jgi:hypothetical protein
VACSLTHTGIVYCLKRVKKFHQDVETTVLDIMQTRSVNRFNALFQMLSNTKLMGLMITKFTAKEFLALAEQRYADKLAEPGKSTFNITDDKTPPVEVDRWAKRKCWSCGQIGHMSRECSPPRCRTRGGGRNVHRRGGDDAAISWHSTPPQANDEKTKTVSGTIWLCCAGSTCTGTLAPWTT